jgi:hypothetical protein
MNQMVHDLPNLIGIDRDGIEERIRQFFPNFMGLMNVDGMGEMFEMYGTAHKGHHAHGSFPPNIAPIGNPGPFGVIELGGMFTLLKVREEAAEGSRWYQHPAGTTASLANEHEAPRPQTMHQNKESNPSSWFSQEEAENIKR